MEFMCTKEKYGCVWLELTGGKFEAGRLDGGHGSNEGHASALVNRQK